MDWMWAKAHQILDGVGDPMRWYKPPKTMGQHEKHFYD